MKAEVPSASFEAAVDESLSRRTPRVTKQKNVKYLKEGGGMAVSKRAWAFQGTAKLVVSFAPAAVSPESC